MASEDPGPIVIRDPVPDDEDAWRSLWAGYCAFYETKVPEAVTAATWARMLTGSQLFGRLAEWKGGRVSPSRFSMQVHGRSPRSAISKICSSRRRQEAMASAARSSKTCSRWQRHVAWRVSTGTRDSQAPLRQVRGSGRFRPLPLDPLLGRFAWHGFCRHSEPANHYVHAAAHARCNTLERCCPNFRLTSRLVSHAFHLRFGSKADSHNSFMSALPRKRT